MVVSFHESGATLYPGTGFEHEIGAGEGEGYNVNLPLPVGTYDDAYQGAFMQVIPPLAGTFDPDVIVLELGTDGLAGDPPESPSEFPVDPNLPRKKGHLREDHE